MNAEGTTHGSYTMWSLSSERTFFSGGPSAGSGIERLPAVAIGRASRASALLCSGWEARSEK